LVDAFQGPRGRFGLRRDCRIGLRGEAGKILFFWAKLLLDSQRLPRSDALWVIILPTSDDKAGVQFFDRPGRREAAGGCYFDSNQSTDQPRFFIVESISSPQM